jgi:hypothetical protein
MVTPRCQSAPNPATAVTSSSFPAMCDSKYQFFAGNARELGTRSVVDDSLTRTPSPLGLRSRAVRRKGQARSERSVACLGEDFTFARVCWRLYVLERRRRAPERPSSPRPLLSERVEALAGLGAELQLPVSSAAISARPLTGSLRPTPSRRREFVVEHRLVDEAGGPAVEVDQPGGRRLPGPLGPLDNVGHQDAGVQLVVAGAPRSGAVRRHPGPGWALASAPAPSRADTAWTSRSATTLATTAARTLANTPSRSDRRGG